MLPAMTIELSARIGALIVTSGTASGAPAGAIEAETGFVAATADDPDARIPLSLETRLWATAERLSGDADLGLNTALRVQPGMFDVLDYAVRTAPTLRVALERLARYNRLEHDAAEFHVHSVDPGPTERTRVLHAFRGGVPGQTLGQHRHSIEFTLASLVVIGRQLSGRPLAARAVSFAHAAPPRPETQAAHLALFGCRPAFGAAGNVIEFDAAELRQPLPAADPRLWRVIERHAEALLAARPAAPTSLAARIARELTGALGEGAPSLEGMARRLRMSARSLQRHLQAEGLRYDTLLEGLRRDLALSYLADPKVAIAEVAYLVGYSEPSAFHRAFKRWTGTTPGELRAAQSA